LFGGAPQHLQAEAVEPARRFQDTYAEEDDDEWPEEKEPAELGAARRAALRAVLKKTRSVALVECGRM